jgi:hypothetical protein
MSGVSKRSCSPLFFSLLAGNRPSGWGGGKPTAFQGHQRVGEEETASELPLIRAISVFQGFSYKIVKT